MNTSLKYTKTIFIGHKYLLVSVPLYALIAYLALFYFTNNIVFSLVNEVHVNGQINYLKATELANRKYNDSSIILAIVLPFVHLLFLQNLFPKTYEFILPISALQRLIAYLMVSITIYVGNLLCLALFNYLLELYFQSKFLAIAQQGFDQYGYLYHTISSESLLYNGRVNIALVKLGNIFFLILPFFYICILYFKKNSALKSAIIFLTAIALARFISFLIWPEDFTYINNNLYNQLYPIFVCISASIVCLIGFYYFLKEREV